MYPFEEIRKEVVKRSFGRVFDEVLGYLNLYDFMKLKTIVLTGKSKNVSIDSFWYSILGDKFARRHRSSFVPIKSGDVIKIKDVFMSEWAPKLTGTTLDTAGIERFAGGTATAGWFCTTKTGRHHCGDRPPSERKVDSAGFGSVRTKPSVRDDNYCAYLSLVDMKSWLCDYGIPLIVSRSVYKQFQKYAVHGAPWIEELEGVMHMHEDIPLTSFIPRAIGATLSAETEETLRFRPNLPKVFI